MTLLRPHQSRICNRVLAESVPHLRWLIGRSAIWCVLIPRRKPASDVCSVLRHNAVDRRAVVRHLCPSVVGGLLLRIETRSAFLLPFVHPVLMNLAQALRHPVRVNQIPRQIPQIPRYLQPWVSTIPSHRSTGDDVDRLVSIGRHTVSRYPPFR